MIFSREGGTRGFFLNFSRGEKVAKASPCPPSDAHEKRHCWLRNLSFHLCSCLSLKPYSEVRSQMYETTFSEIIQRFCYMQINLFNI